MYTVLVVGTFFIIDVISDANHFSIKSVVNKLGKKEEKLLRILIGIALIFLYIYL
ncbi:MAG: hypothetical protein MK202_08345 [Tenacibaculum sp.]|nr:hypothetical protein [Tenacibaculum sp.]